MLLFNQQPNNKQLHSYADRLKSYTHGAEVVIVSAHPADNSAIYWKRGGNYFTFCTATGEMERSHDYTDERFIKHLQKMQNDAALIFIRGTGK